MAPSVPSPGGGAFSRAAPGPNFAASSGSRLGFQTTAPLSDSSACRLVGRDTPDELRSPAAPGLSPPFSGGWHGEFLGSGSCRRQWERRSFAHRGASTRSQTQSGNRPVGRMTLFPCQWLVFTPSHVLHGAYRSTPSGEPAYQTPLT